MLPAKPEIRQFAKCLKDFRQIAKCLSGFRQNVKCLSKTRIIWNIFNIKWFLVIKICQWNFTKYHIQDSDYRKKYMYNICKDNLLGVTYLISFKLKHILITKNHLILKIYQIILILLRHFAFCLKSTRHFAICLKHLRHFAICLKHPRHFAICLKPLRLFAICLISGFAGNIYIVYCLFVQQ